MSDFDMDWTGMDQLQAAFVRAGSQVDAAARANVTQASMILIKDAQGNFEGSHKKGQPHVGGSKPNVVTGNLRRSIMADGITHIAMGSYATTVGPTMRYGRRVELGLAPTGAYPYFGPAAADLRHQMGSIAAANWERHIKF
ncbi:HK97 gp10 family phage protein [Arthrobacter sp. ISL-69]|uniref:HK97 gp10 family phage protein n=1 Tax=Arthrobacter sp. ISL-69 TaxID=2819113 RepID=UPI001BE735F2|nr:HK97 gp10 family phage protein [Arthrobacter sp. ISL-69]MBT2537195.1 HK97 gp10 family phage protein [Arthrobacter sp. ISL-69]